MDRASKQLFESSRAEVWQHSGDLLCTSFGKMLAMHVQEFCDIVCKSSSIRSAAHKYALSFVTALPLDFISISMTYPRATRGIRNLLPQLNDFSTPLLLETQTQRRSSRLAFAAKSSMFSGLVSLPGLGARDLLYL